MKQFITKQDLEELSDYQIDKLFEYWWDNESEPRNGRTPSEYIEYGGKGMKYALPLMSIGDMIEYLKRPDTAMTISECENTWYVENFYDFAEESELCNSLWDLVKKVLNK